MLEALRDDVRSVISNHVILQTQLPVIGASIADDLDLETMLSDGLFDPINTYFGGAPTARVAPRWRRCECRRRP